MSSSSMSSAASGPPHLRVYSRGTSNDTDVLLEVGPKRIPCIVAYRSLASESSLFDLEPEPFTPLDKRHGAGAVKAKYWLNDANFNGLDMLFTIIQRAAHEVPTKIEITERAEFLDLSSGPPWAPDCPWLNEDLLLSIALAADRYNIPWDLKPWARTWLDPFRDFKPGTACREVLWAAWLLGDEALVTAQLDDLAIRTVWKEDQPDQFYITDTIREDWCAFESLDLAGADVFIRPRIARIGPGLWGMSSSLDPVSMAICTNMACQ